MLDIAYDPIVTIEQPVMAIHGSAGTGSQWQALQAHCDYQGGFFAPDAPPQPGDKTLWSRVLPLLQWVAAQSQPTHIVAHSFGCALALEVAKALPEKVQSLVFYEPVVPSILKQTEDRNNLALLSEIEQLAAMARYPGGEEGMEYFINYWSDADVWSKLPATKRQEFARQAEGIAEDFSQAMKVDKNSFRTIAADIPMAIIAGAQTKPVAKRMASLLQANHRNTASVEIAQLGHMGVFLSPQTVNPCIADFIGQYK